MKKLVRYEKANSIEKEAELFYSRLTTTCRNQNITHLVFAGDAADEEEELLYDTAEKHCGICEEGTCRRDRKRKGIKVYHGRTDRYRRIGLRTESHVYCAGKLGKEKQHVQNGSEIHQ